MKVLFFIGIIILNPLRHGNLAAWLIQEPELSIKTADTDIAE